jgi:hypothetical protein
VSPCQPVPADANKGKPFQCRATLSFSIIEVPLFENGFHSWREISTAPLTLYTNWPLLHVNELLVVAKEVVDAARESLGMIYSQ